MIKHIVIYKLKNRNESEKEKLCEKFNSMRGKIPYLKSLIAGSDILNSERSYDVALICEFESLEDLNKYKTHEVHLPIVDYVKSVAEISHSVDFEF